MRVTQWWSIRDRIRNNIERYGLSQALADVVIRVINRVVFFKILKCVRASTVDPSCLQVPNKYQCGFIARRLLMEYSWRKEYEMSEEFLQKALEKGDECFVILDGDILASYGWYSNKTTDLLGDLKVHFDSKYIYMYKGFTHPDYRGQRLHAIGMAMALKKYLDGGFKGLVSCVESNNFSSLKSVYRMGYQDFGKIYVIRILGRYLAYCTGACRDYGFGLETERYQRPDSPWLLDVQSLRDPVLELPIHQDIMPARVEYRAEQVSRW